MSHSLENILLKKDTGKIRKYLAKLFLNDKRYIRLCRTYAMLDDDPNSNTFGRAIKKGIRTIKWYHYVKPDGKKGSIKVDKGTQASMLVVRRNGYSDKINLKNCSGYYPHVFYKKEWRPLFCRVVENRLTDAEYYANLKPVIQDLEFWCFVSKDGKGIKQNIHTFSVLESHDKQHERLVGGDANFVIKAKESNPPTDYDSTMVDRIIKNFVKRSEKRSMKNER